MINVNENQKVSIIHCDMDAFFASVEQLTNPALKSKPVIVGGHPKSRGVVSTCSYEARKFGIRSAMPVAEAYRRCPSAIFLSPDFSKYKKYSGLMHKIFEEYTPLIEPISLDEAFLDVTGCETIFGPAPEIGKKIKQRIREEVGLTISVGIAHNKFLAKLASDLSKPDGFLVIDPKRVQSFLDPLDIGRVWGVGEKTALKLRNLNIKTIKDLRQLDEAHLIQIFGTFGHQLYLLARGIDNREIVKCRKAKSVGRETTFAEDISKYEELEKVILELSSEVGRNLRKDGIKGRTVTIKIKYFDFKTVTRSKTLESATNIDEDIYREARCLLKNLLVKPIRLAGVSVQNLIELEEPQLTLFGETKDEKARLSQAVDIVKDKFGDNIITWARLLKKPTHESDKN